MRITSRNINGIRAILNKGFLQWVKKDDPDILCLQEVKAFETQLPTDFRYHMQDYNMIWHAGTRPGYAGVATFYRKSLKLISSKSRFEDIEHFHEDGRVVETKFQVSSFKKGGGPHAVEDFVLLNIYFPNGGERSDGTEMLGYKLKFYDHFLHYIDALRAKGEKIISCGDFNICHREIDIARPKENADAIGFLPVERAKMDELEKDKYVDVFRHFYPDVKDEYTRRSHRAGSRARNVGRRLDYFWVSANVVPYIKSITHQTAIQGSDHCPISLELSW